MIDLLADAMPIPFSGCWIGYDYIQQNGYAYKGPGLGHRQVWEQAYGAVPEGYEIHHKCRVKCCWNLLHLELKSISEHRVEHGNQYSSIEFCKNGHQYTVENTYYYPRTFKRGCKQCRRKLVREAMRKKRNSNFTRPED